LDRSAGPSRPEGLPSGTVRHYPTVPSSGSPPRSLRYAPTSGSSRRHGVVTLRSTFHPSPRGPGRRSMRHRTSQILRILPAPGSVTRRALGPFYHATVTVFALRRSRISSPVVTRSTRMCRDRRSMDFWSPECATPHVPRGATPYYTGSQDSVCPRLWTPCGTLRSHPAPIVLPAALACLLARTLASYSPRSPPGRSQAATGHPADGTTHEEQAARWGARVRSRGGVSHHRGWKQELS